MSMPCPVNSLKGFAAMGEGSEKVLWGIHLMFWDLQYEMLDPVS